MPGHRRDPEDRAGRGVSRYLWLLLVGAPALLALLLHLELRGSEYFRVLAVDARTYHETAAALAGGSFRPDGPWWQPPFYPLFLSVLYRLFGADPTAAYVVQALLHGATAAMVFGLGRSWFGTRAAWISWGIVAGFGPLVFHTQQLLPPTLCVALLVASIWRLARPGGLWTRVVAGGLLGLAVITVASLLLVLPVLLWWIWSDRDRDGEGGDGARGGRRSEPRWLSPTVFAAMALLPALLVTGWNARAGGEAVFISYNGGINFWIGNNPEYDRTVAIRPGRAWKALTLEPQIAGARGYNAQSRWFYDRAFCWIGENPGAALSLGIRKLHLTLRGDELMRNQAIYPFRSESFLLRLLLGSLSPAFPFGWLWPLAAVGAWVVLRERGKGAHAARFLLLLSLVLLISVVAFFVTGRYRLPLVPFLALLAAPGALALVDAVRARAWGQQGWVCAPHPGTAGRTPRNSAGRFGLEQRCALRRRARAAERRGSGRSEGDVRASTGSRPEQSRGDEQPGRSLDGRGAERRCVAALPEGAGGLSGRSQRTEQPGGSLPADGGVLPGGERVPADPRPRSERRTRSGQSGDVRCGGGTTRAGVDEQRTDEVPRCDAGQLSRRSEQRLPAGADDPALRDGRSRRGADQPAAGGNPTLILLSAARGSL
ncbi:MAG: glycosyltransferase family 39 protein [Candidatus Eisenbacteria bacterium]|nr:glycosyltransferase family 39 protein [Candidatus Eisenbacteria bacterium]